MYILVKLLTHFQLWVAFKRVGFFNSSKSSIETPLVIGVNHPNSFLDAMVVGASMKHRVHFITRSGVFKHPLVRMILRSVNMIPIYRMSDGKHTLSNNDATFEEVRKILLRGEHVLIFVEGFCTRKDTLQTPLKKGAPRMLTQAWNDGLDVKLLPVWVRYSSLEDFGKELDINFGEPFGKEKIDTRLENGALMFAINKETERQLEDLSKIYNPKPKVISKAFLFIPAMLGVVTHILLFYPLQKLAWKLRFDQYYDSILFCLLAFLYPVYILAVAGVVYWYLGALYAAISLVLLPLLAKSFVMWK